jgi:hypothetical protein
MGLGLEGVQEIAHAEFGLSDLGLAELERLHGQLLKGVFAELAAFLRDDTVEVIADNLGSTREWLVDNLEHYFGKPLDVPQLRQWFRGGQPLHRRIQEMLWAVVERCTRKPQYHDHLRRRVIGPQLYLDLFGRRVTTLTGRVRGRLLFCEACQAEYLDLADDAVKAAAFALADGGFPVAAVAGGALVTHVHPTPDAAGEARRAERLAGQAAGEVIRPVPAACAARWADFW